MERVRGWRWPPTPAGMAPRAASDVAVSRSVGEGMLARNAEGREDVDAPLVQGFRGGLAERATGAPLAEEVAVVPSAAAVGRRMATVVTAGPQNASPGRPVVAEAGAEVRETRVPAAAPCEKEVVRRRFRAAEILVVRAAE